MRKPLLFFTTLFFLSGCFAALQIDAPIVPEKKEVFKPFPSGVPMEAKVGEQMLGYNLLLTTYTVPGYEAIEDFIFPALISAHDLLIKKGEEFISIATVKDGGYLIKSLEKRKFAGNAMMSSHDWDLCLAVNSTGEPYAFAGCELKNPVLSLWEKKPANFLKPKTIINDKLAARREALIVYAGKTKDGIRLLYQETALKDMEFTFDLSEGRMVAVKDIVFEIIEATNMSIKYIIKTTPEELKGKIEKREKEAQAQSI